MKSATTLVALFFTAVVFLTSVHATNKVNNGEQFSILHEVTRHDCKQILGEPNLLLLETKELREAYVYELVNDWHFMIYFEKHGNYVHSFGIQPTNLAADDRPPSSIQPSVVVARP